MKRTCHGNNFKGDSTKKNENIVRSEDGMRVP